MRARARTSLAASRTFERLIDIRGIALVFVERKVAVLKDRDAIEWMQGEVTGRAHLGFESRKCMNSFVSEYQPDDMDISAAWENQVRRHRSWRGFR